MNINIIKIQEMLYEKTLEYTKKKCDENKIDWEHHLEYISTTIKDAIKKLYYPAYIKDYQLEKNIIRLISDNSNKEFIIGCFKKSFLPDEIKFNKNNLKENEITHYEDIITKNKKRYHKLKDLSDSDLDRLISILESIYYNNIIEQYDSEDKRTFRVSKKTIKNNATNQELNLIIAFDTEYYYKNLLKDIRGEKDKINKFIDYSLSKSIPEINQNTTLSYQIYLILYDDEYNIYEEISIFYDAFKYGRLAMEEILNTIFKEISLDKIDKKNIIFIAHFNSADLFEIKNIKKVINNEYFVGNLIKKHCYAGNFYYNAESIKIEPIINRNGQNVISIKLKDLYALTGESLSELGKSLSTDNELDKLYNPLIQNMDILYDEDKVFFEKYAMRDAEITAKFYIQFMKELSVFGTEEILKAETIGGISARIFKERLKNDPVKAEHLGYKYSSESKYISIKTKTGDSKNVYVTSKKLDTIELEEEFKETYFGGRNETYFYGYLDNSNDIVDYDISSCYSSAMMSIQGWDFSEPAKQIYDHKKLYDYLKKNPNDLALIKLDFEFKQDIMYPAIPIKCENNGIYPVKGVSYILTNTYLACYKDLKYCRIKKCAIYPAVKTEDQSLISELITEYIIKRNNAKNPIENKILKLLSNNLYGKTAEGVNQNKGRRISIAHTVFQDGETKISYKSKNKNEKGIITNLILASFVTDYIRSIAYEYLKYLSQFFDWEKKKFVINFTTDGFMLANISESELMKEKDFFRGVGEISERLSKRNGKLLNKYQIIEKKHYGKGCIAIKTRSYTMLEYSNEKQADKDLLSAITGISLRDITNTNKEKADFIFNEFKSLYRFEDTFYKFKHFVSETNLLLNGYGLVKIPDIKSYNFDFDFKRNIFDEKYIKNRYIDEIEIEKGREKRIRFYTTPIISADNFTRNRANIFNFLRGQLDEKGNHKTKNKILTIADLDEFIEYCKTSYIIRDKLNMQRTLKDGLKIITIALFRYVLDDAVSLRELGRISDLDKDAIQRLYKKFLLIDKKEKRTVPDIINDKEIKKWLRPYYSKYIKKLKNKISEEDFERLKSVFY